MAHASLAAFVSRGLESFVSDWQSDTDCSAAVGVAYIGLQPAIHTLNVKFMLPACSIANVALIVHGIIIIIIINEYD